MAGAALVGATLLVLVADLLTWAACRAAARADEEGPQ